jgi:hypothetical protein
VQCHEFLLISFSGREGSHHNFTGWIHSPIPSAVQLLLGVVGLLNGNKLKLQLILPEQKRIEVMKFFHDMPTAGHLGIEKTLEKVKESFYWPGMKDYIHDYCRQCYRCFSRMPKRQKNKAPLGSYLVGEPMEIIAIDILGPLPLTKSGNRFILVITDTFTKWTEAWHVMEEFHDFYPFLLW